jgi:hypothetical protein
MCVCAIAKHCEHNPIINVTIVSLTIITSILRYRCAPITFPLEARTPFILTSIDQSRSTLRIRLLYLNTNMDFPINSIASALQIATTCQGLTHRIPTRFILANVRLRMRELLLNGASLLTTWAWSQSNITRTLIVDFFGTQIHQWNLAQCWTPSSSSHHEILDSTLSAPRRARSRYLQLNAYVNVKW